jgi:hypothetical protein
VIGAHVLPLTLTGAAFERAVSDNPFLSVATDVPFYVWSLPPLAFTLLLQSALVITFGTMALRRWKSSTRHSMSKPYALGFLLTFIVTLLGNVWPIITRQSMPFALFGERDLEQLGEIITIGLPQVYALVTWVLCYVLFAIVVPSRHSYVRGIRRALKHGHSAARFWDDDADGLPFILLVVAAVLAGYGVLFGELSASGFFADFTNGVTGLWRLPLALTLVVVYSGLVIQVFGLKPTVLVILLVGVLPILIAAVMSAAAQGVGYPQAIVASLSPLALVVGSGMLPPATAMGPGEIDGELAIAMTGANTGLAFIVLQIAYLLVRWQKQKRSDYTACRAFVFESKAAVLAPQTR